MDYRKYREIAIRLGSAAAVCLVILEGGLAAAQQTIEDESHRSSDLYHYRTAGKSSPARGEELYYFKCC